MDTAIFAGRKNSMGPMTMVEKLSIPVHPDMSPNTLAVLVLAKLLGSSQQAPLAEPVMMSRDQVSRAYHSRKEGVQNLLHLQTFP